MPTPAVRPYKRWWPATSRPRSYPPAAPAAGRARSLAQRSARLLQLHRSARLLELRLGSFGLGLVHAFLHRLRRALDQVLRFLQTETRELANDFDDLDL